MKTLVRNYTFSPSTRQIYLSGFGPMTLNQVLLVTNVSNNSIIYNFADPTAGGYMISNVLYLSANTTSMSPTDSLQIFLDDGIEVYQNGFGIPHFDYKEINYSGSNISTIVYRLGGSGGSAVTTLTYSYSGSNLTGISKS